MQVEMIKQDALITMQFNPPFLQRLQNLFSWMVNNQDVATVKETNDKIMRQSDDLDEWGEHYLTMMVLVADMEKTAKEQSLTEMVEIPEQVKS